MDNAPKTKPCDLSLKLSDNPACACPRPHPEDEQTLLLVTIQTVQAAFKVLLENVPHMLGKSPSSVNNWPCLCIIATCFSILLLTHIRMFEFCPSQGFCVGGHPLLATRYAFVDFSLPVSPTWTSHRGSLSVTRNNETGVGAALTSAPRKRDGLNKMLCHGAFFLWGLLCLMTTQIRSVAIDNEAL